MIDAALDLLLGSTCAGCAAPGRMLCPDCRVALPRSARVSWPSPTPQGLVTPWASAPFDGAVRQLIVGHKDHGQLAHRRVLGPLLAQAVRGAVEDIRDDCPILLVPVPSRPGSARRRGHDPAGALARAAARHLMKDPATTQDVRMVPLLASRGGVTDQAGLDAVERAANIAGSMTCPARRLRQLGRRGLSRVHVVVCDDVLTTGATAREAQRALDAVGLTPVAVATIAATVRRDQRQVPSSLSRRRQTG